MRKFIINPPKQDLGVIFYVVEIKEGFGEPGDFEYLDKKGEKTPWHGVIVFRGDLVNCQAYIQLAEKGCFDLPNSTIKPTSRTAQ